MYSVITRLHILDGLGCLLAGTITAVDAAPGAGDRVDVIGTRVTDAKGRQHRIGVSTGKVGAAALVFLDTACPVATRYIPVLNELHDHAQARGLSLYGVLSNPGIGWRESARFVDDFDVEFPVILDSVGDLALRFGPRVTSEAFVVSFANRIVYRGRIGDRFAAVGRLRTRVTSHDLRDVIEAMAGGGRPEPHETAAVGCFHHAWRERGAPGAGTEEVTWARHVAPLLQANCVECHRQGGIAPFSLEGYENARRWHRMIAWMTGERLMPPWRSVPGFGEFRDARRLSVRQIELLRTWSRTGSGRSAPDRHLGLGDHRRDERAVVRLHCGFAERPRPYCECGRTIVVSTGAGERCGNREAPGAAPRAGTGMTATDPVGFAGRAARSPPPNSANLPKSAALSRVIDGAPPGALRGRAYSFMAESWSRRRRPGRSNVPGGDARMCGRRGFAHGQ